MSDKVRGKVKSIVEDVMDEKFEDIQEQNKNKIKDAIEKQNEAKEKIKQGKGDKMGKFIIALAGGDGDVKRAAKFAEEKLGDEDVAKSLNLADYESGGVLAPHEYSSEIIELLRPITAVRQLGAQTMPLVGGALFPRQVSGANSYYVGEEDEVNASDLDMGDLKMEEKQLVSVVPVSNKLIRVAGDRATQIVTNDLTQGFAVKSDSKFIRGKGTQHSPQGMLYWATTGNKFNSNYDSGNELETVDQDLTQVQYLLKKADIPMNDPGWIINPRTELFLMRLKDADGNYVYKDEMMDGTLWGFPYVATNQVPANLGVGGDETEIYFADFSQLMIAETQEIMFKISDEAAYRDSEGNLQSAFSKNQTVVQGMAIHDFAARHPEAVAVVEQVTYGA